MHCLSAMQSIVKCAKSGWPVSGQKQVNSGIWNWMTKSRSGAGLGNTSRCLDGTEGGLAGLARVPTSMAALPALRAGAEGLAAVFFWVLAVVPAGAFLAMGSTCV